MRLRSLENCQLSIASYPKFNYDASGGGGKGIMNPPNEKGLCKISFNPETFSIPPLNYKTTKWLGINLPPGIAITIVNEELKGYIHTPSKEISLSFRARFRFSICRYIKAPDLIVETCLNSKEVEINRKKIRGSALQKDGKTTLVGIAFIGLTGNIFLDTFLSLPNKALAILNCQVTELEY